MPYYRIVIWTKRRKQPFAGIRIISDPNINAVQQKFTNTAREKFQQDLIDVEVQMLSKLSTVVKLFERKESSKNSF